EADAKKKWLVFEITQHADGRGGDLAVEELVVCDVGGAGRFEFGLVAVDVARLGLPLLDRVGAGCQELVVPGRLPAWNAPGFGIVVVAVGDMKDFADAAGLV